MVILSWTSQYVKMMTLLWLLLWITWRLMEDLEIQLNSVIYNGLSSFAFFEIRRNFKSLMHNNHTSSVLYYDFFIVAFEFIHTINIFLKTEALFTDSFCCNDGKMQYFFYDGEPWRFNTEVSVTGMLKTQLYFF